MRSCYGAPRVAKKEYRCSNCRKPILVGEKYSQMQRDGGAFRRHEADCRRIEGSGCFSFYADTGEYVDYPGEFHHKP